MSVTSCDPAAHEVLREFPMIRSTDLVEALGSSGGFSGARIWRIESTAGPFCLKAWPTSGPSRIRLGQIHDLMRLARRHGLDFVPEVFNTRHEASCVIHAGRIWDLTRWLPGRADFHDRPLPARLEAACIALAQLHAVWATIDATSGPCPAIERRLRCAHDWADWIKTGWQPPFDADEPLRSLTQRAWPLLQRWLAWIPRALAPWVDQHLPLQPCLCDVWHDHILFEADRLTGLIDYGAVKVDHFTVDLARLLGSMASDRPALRSAGLKAYARIRPLTWQDEALIGALDETGTIVGVANWLRWLYRAPKRFDDRLAVVRRLGELVQRIECLG